MNNSVNFNELRKLAKAIKKIRPILGSLLIRDGKAYFTNTIYIVVMGGYERNENKTIDMETYLEPIGVYPNLDRIIDKRFELRPFEKVIYNNEVIFKINSSLFHSNIDLYIDNKIIAQIEKITSVKNFTFDIEKVETNSIIGRYVVNDELTIYFSMKRWQGE